MASSQEIGGNSKTWDKGMKQHAIHHYLALEGHRPPPYAIYIINTILIIYGSLNITKAEVTSGPVGRDPSQNCQIPFRIGIGRWARRVD